jgi:release factor glutamine methyltransferase
MKLKDWLKVNRPFFGESDLRFLVKNLFNTDSLGALAGDIRINPQNLEYLDGIKELCAKGMPLAYILGKEEFFGREFGVSREVLIPRPATELIVERAIDIINKNNLKSVLDLGCGTGNIAITIKKEVSCDLTVFASDVSFSAVEVAGANSELNAASIRLINADLFSAFKFESFDLIISNPPYVERENIKGSLLFEPKIALEAGDDGLYFINKIIKQAHCYLQDSGYLMVEVGYKHAPAVDKLVEEAASYESKEWIKDYSGIFRGIILRKKNG